MPQEIEVFYLIPAIRRSLAQIFKNEHKLSQKEVASLLGVTEAAVSQYLKQKRAHGIKFSKKDELVLKEGAKKILSDKENVMKYVYDLTVKLRGSDAMCELHKSQDKNVDVNCRICME